MNLIINRQWIVIFLIILSCNSYGASLEKLKNKALSGDVDSQYKLGHMFFLGKKKDSLNSFLEAEKWLQIASNHGHRSAQYELGMLYETGGYGVTKDHKKSVSMYQKAAKQGSGVAQVALANSYYHGLGVTQDKFTSYIWTMVANENDPFTLLFAKFSPEKLQNELPYNLAKLAEEYANMCINSNYDTCYPF